MNTSFWHRLKRFFKNGWVIAGIVILAIILLISFARGGSKTRIESATAVVGNVVEKVSVTGKVSPFGKADLAFEKSGVVRQINYKVGDRVPRGATIAMLDSAGDSAAAASAQSQLAELTRALRPEEYAADESAVATASTSLTNANKDAVNASRDGYVKAQNAVISHGDTFFNNAQSALPTINIRTQSTASETAINQERLAVTQAFSNWKNDMDASPALDASTLITRAEKYQNIIKNFLSDLSAIVSSLTTSSSGLSQSTLDSYMAAMNTAQSTLNQAISSVTAADTALKSASSGYMQASNQFNLQKAGSSAQTIAAQAAKVAQARAELNKDFLISPLDGVLTKAVPDVGEFVPAGQTVFAVQSDGAFKIEAYVPEADIAKLSLDDMATVTLDAYGSYVVFPATVTMIDPAETILEGVPTYKVTLQFNVPDARIRSGMTANTDIETHERKNVLNIPTRAVTDDHGVKTVRVLRSDGKNFDTVTVVTGLKGSDGNIEIVSGLKEGQKVVTFVK